MPRSAQVAQNGSHARSLYGVMRSRCAGRFTPLRPIAAAARASLVARSMSHIDSCARPTWRCGSTEHEVAQPTVVDLVADARDLRIFGRKVALARARQQMQPKREWLAVLAAMEDHSSGDAVVVHVAKSSVDVVVAFGLEVAPDATPVPLWARRPAPRNPCPARARTTRSARRWPRCRRRTRRGTWRGSRAAGLRPTVGRHGCRSTR